MGKMAVADASLGVGGTLAAVIRDELQKRHETKRRRSDKFEELVAAVYEFEHWLTLVRQRELYGIEAVY
jgi:hypothetical protein